MSLVKTEAVLYLYLLLAILLINSETYKNLSFRRKYNQQHNNLIIWLIKNSHNVAP